MAQSLATLNQIAAKRLSGKAMTSGITTLAGEKIGSTVQTVASTVFGESLPNNPDSGSAYWYLIQSASNGSPGTVQYVEFILEPVASSNYDNDGAEDTDAFAGENPFSDITDEIDGSNDPLTYHAYAIKLPDNYVNLVTNAEADFDTNASTDTALGSGVFSNGYYASGSRGRLQVVPEYVSNLPVNNPYVPVLVSSNNEIITPTDPIDWYFDSYAGILFVQDPSDYGDIGNANLEADIPAKLRAFLYVGKYQDDIAGGDTDVSLHFSASQGGGFSITNNTTASFETGSTSGGGLTIQAPGNNSISFTLNNVISGSEQILNEIEGPTTINITASYAEESVEVGITDLQDNAFHPIVFTFDPLGSAPAGGTTTFEKLAISNDSSTSNQGLYYNPQDADLRLVDNDNDFLSIKPNQIVAGGNVNSFTILSNTPIINLGGSNTNAVNLGGGDHGTTTTAIGTFKVNSWDPQTQDVYNSTVTGSFGIDLVHVNTGSFVISNIDESAERTPLVIDNNGKVTKANADFATAIIEEGGGLISVALSAGSGQGTYDLSANSAVVSNDISAGLTTTDAPTFAGVKANGTSFPIATQQGTTGNQTITIGNSANNDNQITLNGTANITGDLIVQGDTTTLNTTNLLVEDKFILLNSGTLSNPAAEGGIIVQTQANSAGGKGTALFYDSALNGWLTTKKDMVAGDATGIDIQALSPSSASMIVGVQNGANTPTAEPFTGAGSFKLGQMYVHTSDTANGGLYIYLPS